MSQRRIIVDDAHLRQIMSAVITTASDVDNERRWLATARQPIQPYGQVWSLADGLVTAWDQRCQELSGWYDRLSANLQTLVTQLDAARGIHDLAEGTASDLATRGMG